VTYFVYINTVEFELQNKKKIFFWQASSKIQQPESLDISGVEDAELITQQAELIFQNNIIP